MPPQIDFALLAARLHLLWRRTIKAVPLGVFVVCVTVAVWVTAFPALALRSAEVVGPPSATGADTPAAPLDQLRSRASYWRSGDERTLTYWINLRSFCHTEANPDTGCARADGISANLAAAAQDWMDACPDCRLRFERVDRKDKAVFTVQYVTRTRDSPLPPRYVAHAFYPFSAKTSRVLRISSRYRTDHPDYDAVGVLRHELGHILGYTHEHAAADPKQQTTCGWTGERLPAKVRAIAVTEYDPQSIMHYPCGTSRAKATFALSPRDIAGHRALYGPSPSP
ncbi:matrixin family metalloprotease [Azospirillum griseum]|nr:matrixin family metalloprotease [Azospirillum griseum]